GLLDHPVGRLGVEDSLDSGKPGTCVSVLAELVAIERENPICLPQFLPSRLLRDVKILQLADSVRQGVKIVFVFDEVAEKLIAILNRTGFGDPPQRIGYRRRARLIAGPR